MLVAVIRCWNTCLVSSVGILYVCGTSTDSNCFGGRAFLQHPPCSCSQEQRDQLQVLRLPLRRQRRRGRREAKPPRPQPRRLHPQRSPKTSELPGQDGSDASRSTCTVCYIEVWSFVYVHFRHWTVGRYAAMTRFGGQGSCTFPRKAVL